MTGAGAESAGQKTHRARASRDRHGCAALIPSIRLKFTSTPSKRMYSSKELPKRFAEIVLHGEDEFLAASGQKASGHLNELRG